MLCLLAQARVGLVLFHTQSYIESEPQPIIVSAKIPNYKSLDPQSVGMALLSASAIVPYSYDPNDGSITLVLRDAVDALKGKATRALVWATELKSGKRVEASWTFQVPEANAPTEKVVAPRPDPTNLETGTSGSGGPAGGAHVRAPR